MPRRVAAFLLSEPTKFSLLKENCIVEIDSATATATANQLKGVRCQQSAVWSPGRIGHLWPTKGATAEMVNILDEALENWGRHIYQATGREVINAPGAGAAGEMGGALLGLLNAELRADVEIVVETLQLEQAVKDADLVITGEGRLARQA